MWVKPAQLSVGCNDMRLHHTCFNDLFEIADALINGLHIVDDPGVMDFVVEETENNVILQEALLDCVQRSNVDVNVAQAASHAIQSLFERGGNSMAPICEEFLSLGLILALGGSTELCYKLQTSAA